MMKTDSQGAQPNSVSSFSDSNCDETESAANLRERVSAKRKNERSEDIHDESSSQSSCEGEGGESKRLRLEAPMYTDVERQRVVEILEREFNKELQAREEEAMLIEERIQRAQRTLQYLCYAVVSDFYSRDKTITQQVTSTRQRRIHPAVKELLAGKHPKDSTQASTSSTDSSNPPSILSTNSPSQGKGASRTPPKPKRSTVNPESTGSTSSSGTKVPRYIPPKPKDSPGKSGGSSRGAHNKVKQRIVIGNVSKWLPTESREDSATHKWMVYVRGPKDAPDISGFVDKVRFFLHPSYRPNDVVEVVQAPFHISRRGWGEFPVRVQIHFHDPLNKPVDVIHLLKLDRTCTGLQTLGAETVVDVWINKSNNIRPMDGPSLLILSPVGKELEEILDNDDEDIFGVPARSPPLLPERTVKTEPMSPPAATAAAEDSSTVVSSFLQKPNVSDCSNSRNDSKKTDTQTIVLSPSPLKGSRPKTPSSVQVQSPSKVLLKATTSGVLVSSPSKVVLRPTTPVVSSQPVSMLKPVPTSQPVPQLKLAVTTVVTSQPVQQLKPTASSVASPPVPQLKSAVTTVVTSQPVQQLKPTASSVTSQPGPQLKPAVSSVVTSQLVPQLKPVASSGVAGIPTTEATVTPTPIASKILVSSPSKVLLKPSLPGASTSQVQLTSAVPGSLVSNQSKVLILNRPALVPKPTTSAIKPEVVSSPSTLVQPANSTSKVIGNQILTASGQVIKVISPSKVVQSSHPNIQTTLANSLTTNAVNTVTASQNVPLAANSGKPISLVKYKAPDGSIRFLQVSQINSARPALAGQPQNANAIRPRQVVVRPAGHTNVGLPVPRTPSPVIRPPAPSNVTPTPNQGQVLMFRNGKVYLVRPSPNVRQPAQQTLVGQPVPQVPPSVPLPVRAETAVFAPPSTTMAPSMPALVNTIRAIPTAKLQVGVRPTAAPRPAAPRPAAPRPAAPRPAAPRQGVSLLKSNVLQQSPSPLSSPTISPVHSPCASPSPKISHRVILPKPTISPVTASTYRTRLYKQMLSTVVRSCPTKSCAGGVGRAIRWMVRNLPLVSAESRNAEYQLLHPYCAPDMQTFLGWNIGKQRACELMRAQTVLKLLQDVGWDESEIWTVREILIWARFHGYTPGLPLTDSGGGAEATILEEVCDYKTMNAEVADWLSKQETSDVTETVHAESSDEELDVISVNLSPSKVSIKKEPLEQSNSCLADSVEDMPLEAPLAGAGAFLNEVLNNAGIQLEAEQVVTGVRYPAAQRVLLQAVQSLVDDIVRRSLANAWGSNIARSPRSIELPHVCSAILSRPELDFFSCKGLGVNTLPGGQSTSKTNLLNPS